MTEAAALATLRRAVAHVVVDDVDYPAIDDAAEHHLFRVLRVGDGETVTITDGRGRWRACRATAGGLVPEAATIDAGERQVPWTVAVAIPKADRPEWLVQKLTELGIDRIVLLHAERSVVHWDGERAERHVAKLRRTAVEALQQSRGIWLPEIIGPVPAREVLAAMAIAEPGGRPFAPTDRGIAVGPEGGWSQAELDSAADHVSLGPTVLRVETAALAAAVRLVAVRARVITRSARPGHFLTQRCRTTLRCATDGRVEEWTWSIRSTTKTTMPVTANRWANDFARSVSRSGCRCTTSKRSHHRSSRPRCWAPTNAEARALSLPRLDRLAQFYRVPVDQLLPRRADDPGSGVEGTGPRPKLAIDILKLTQLSGAPFEMLTRFLRMIQVQRQDFNGRVLTIRQDDKRAIAAMLDIPVDQVALRLEALDLVFRPS